MSSKYPKLRIESYGDVGYSTYINGILIPSVIETRIDLNCMPKKATIELYVDVDPIEFNGEIKKIVVINGKKYELNEITE